MMRKGQSLVERVQELRFKENSHSVSTEESPRQKVNTFHKEKSQLCKKFVENGYCPYEKRCKFAHGLHELKKNHQANSKYKTKTCGGFLQDGYCPYGNRCNFIHPLPKTQNKISIDPLFLSIKAATSNRSRLISILK